MEIILLSPAAAKRVERGEKAKARTGRMSPVIISYGKFMDGDGKYQVKNGGDDQNRC